jgi:hypothetical protein
VLAAAQAALWMRVLDSSAASTTSGSVPPGTAARDSRLDALDARVTKLEQRPTPDLGPLTARMAALEQRPAAPQAGPSADPRVSILESRLAQLEQRPAPAAPPPPDLGPLEARIATLEQKTSAAAATANAAATTDENLVPRLAADEAKLATLEKTAGGTTQLAERAARIARVQAAFLALSLGQPLGALPGAPPAVTRYATTAPPTDASLRLAFPAAVRAALAADHPSAAKPLLDRIWAEAQDLVTVRQGDRILVGDPAAGVLIHAQTALDAGDLAGAVAAVTALTASNPTGPTLTGPAAEALAGWLDQARGLLAARAALAEMAAQT